MNQDVTDYIAKLNDKPAQQWQVGVCTQLRELVLHTLKDVEERLQWGKPHYLKNGKYAAVISTAKGGVTFFVFNAKGLKAPEGLFDPAEEGADKRTLKVLRAEQKVDYKKLAKALAQAAGV
jgi:hypothetical protein